MNGNTHAVIGAAAGGALALSLDASLIDATVIALLSAGGALLPDIDSRRAAIHSILPTRIASWFIKHRGPTHSLLALLIIGYLSFMFGYPALALGYGSHLFSDALTKSGIPFLWPMRFRFRSPLWIVTGSFSERIIAFLCALIAVYFAIQIYQYNVILP